jgi:fermentation-respiration switch protein FrsA (DUF1100 family)
MTARRILGIAGVFAAVVCSRAGGASAASPQPIERRETITLRGHAQTLHLYGPPDGAPVIVTSGDGGWIRTGPHVAELLAANGFFVVGFDAKAYLEGFTEGATTLRAEDEPGDYHALIAFAARATGKKTLLVGNSEGAGLSVLAGADPANKEAVEGVIGLGLSQVTELGWRWRDMVIYLTHRAPNEPSFSVEAVAPRLAPVPLAAIHSTHDEFAPLAEAQDVLAAAQPPKRLWIVNAGNHHFGDNLADLDRSLLEAVAWIGEARPGAAQ